MPYLKPKKSAELSWDAFPEPPPEAENWVPDPDSIARPGRLPDPRLNKDPYAEQKKAALKRDARLRGLAGVAGSAASSSTSSNDAATSRLDSDWPVATPQTKSPEKSKGSSAGETDLLAARATAVKQGGARGITVSRGESVVSADDPNSAMLTSKKTRPTGPAQVSIPDHAPMPGWAGPLEKLLAEHTAKASPSDKPATSLPPHLRKTDRSSAEASPSKQATTSGPEAYQPLDLDRQFEAATQASRRVSGHSSTRHSSVEALADDEETIDDGVLAWRMATTDIGIADAKEGLRMQQALFRRQVQIVTPHLEEPVEQAYQREIDVKLYRILEDEMDVDKRATRAELSMMDSETFASRFAEVKIAHKKWWDAGKEKKSALKD